MSHGIVLSDLEKYLFPEYFPYFQAHFESDKKLLIEHQPKVYSTPFLNIEFKLRVVGYSLQAKDPDIRKALNMLYNYQVDHFFDWHRGYDWYELKSILLFFKIFTKQKNVRQLNKALDEKHNIILMRKYLPPKKEMVA